MRSVPEWIGQHDDQPIPGYVRLRVLERFNRRCPKCTRSLKHVAWDCDHIVALENGGQHRESNFQPLCESPCHSDKTKADRKLKAKTDHLVRKDFGIRQKLSRQLPGTIASGIKKPLNGNGHFATPIDRRTGQPIGRGRT